MNGYAIIEGKKVIFSFEDNNLTLMFNTKAEVDVRVPEIDLIEFGGEIPFVIGYDFSYQKCYIFLVREKVELSFFHSGTVHVRGYIELNVCYSETENKKYLPLFSGMSLYGKEINAFYNVDRAYRFELPQKEQNNFSGIVGTMPPNETKEKFNFIVGEESIEVNFGIETLYRHSNTPLELTPRIQFKFDETKSIYRLIRLYHIYKSFFQFVTYRRNVDTSRVVLYGKNEVKDFTIVGMFYYDPDQLEAEDEKKVRNIVSYEMIKSHIVKIFDEISSDNLYVQHIPDSKNNARVITPARFVLIMAAFEWNVRHVYEITSGENEKVVKQDILDAMERVPLEKGYTKELKKKYKFFRKIIERVDVNLSGKIAYALNDLHDILSPFIEHIYALNGKEVDKYEMMGDRLQAQRNNFAHGNLDREFDTDVVLDIIILEWVNHAMVLKKFGYTENEIRDLINVIFNRNMYFPKTNSIETKKQNFNNINKKRFLTRTSERFVNRRRFPKKSKN